jgi:hypothetical protein
MFEAQPTKYCGTTQMSHLQDIDAIGNFGGSYGSDRMRWVDATKQVNAYRAAAIGVLVEKYLMVWQMVC